MVLRGTIYRYTIVADGVFFHTKFNHNDCYPYPIPLIDPYKNMSSVHRIPHIQNMINQRSINKNVFPIHRLRQINEPKTCVDQTNRQIRLKRQTNKRARARVRKTENEWRKKKWREKKDWCLAMTISHFLPPFKRCHNTSTTQKNTHQPQTNITSNSIQYSPDRLISCVWVKKNCVKR